MDETRDETGAEPQGEMRASGRTCDLLGIFSEDARRMLGGCSEDARQLPEPLMQEGLSDWIPPGAAVIYFSFI